MSIGAYTGAPNNNNLGIRNYLKQQGYGDSDIGYDNGNVTLKGQNFIGAAPQAQNDPTNGMYQGSTYASQPALTNALKAYQNTYGAPTLSNTQFRTNALNDNLTAVGKAINTPFTYDANSDPAYQSALNLAKSNIQTGQNNTLANLAAHGQGNSSYATTAAQQVADREYNNISNQILPQLINQAYGRYQDQIRNQSALANTLNGLNQQDFSNNLATNQDNRAAEAQNANFTGYYNNPNMSAIQKAMQANSAAYANASPEEQKRLHQENLKLAASIGGTDTTGNGDYAYGPARTLAGQQQDNTVKQQDIMNTRNDRLDTAAEANTAADNARADKQLNATLENMTSDNARANAAEARAAGNQPLATLFDVWDRTGEAPAGIPGVTKGTKLQAKPGSSTTKSDSFNLDDYKGYINSNFYTPADPLDPSKGKTFDSGAARKYIIGLNLPDDSQTDQLLKIYGLPTN